MTHLHLIESPTPDFHARRHDLVQRMAKDLIRFDAIGNEASHRRRYKWCMGLFPLVNNCGL